MGKLILGGMDVDKPGGAFYGYRKAYNHRSRGGKLGHNFDNAGFNERNILDLYGQKAQIILKILRTGEISQTDIEALDMDRAYLDRFVGEYAFNEAANMGTASYDPATGVYTIRDFLALQDSHQELETAQRANQLAADLRGKFDVVLSVGIGGSDLGPKALCYALNHPYHNRLTPEERNGWPEIYFLGQSFNPEKLDLLLERFNPKKILVVYISKSGSTPEPGTVEAYIFDWLCKKMGEERAYKQTVRITEKGSPMDSIPGERFLDTFHIPSIYGGRFSARGSAVGLLPPALVGIDAVEFLTGGIEQGREILGTDVGSEPAFLEAGFASLAAQAGATIFNEYPFHDALELWGGWGRQLFNESTGGKKKIVTPFTVASLGPRDNHSDMQHIQGYAGAANQLVHFYVVGQTRNPEDLVPIPDIFPGTALAEKLGYFCKNGISRHRANINSFLGTEIATSQKGVRNYVTFLPYINAEMLGRLMTHKIAVTLIFDLLYGILPFGQPLVEGYKSYAAAACGEERPGAEAKRALVEARLARLGETF